VCSKTVLVSVNSTVCDMDCNVATIIERLLQVKNCVTRVVWKIKRIKTFINKNFHRNNKSH